PPTVAIGDAESCQAGACSQASAGYSMIATPAESRVVAVRAASPPSDPQAARVASRAVTAIVVVWRRIGIPGPESGGSLKGTPGPREEGTSRLDLEGRGLHDTEDVAVGILDRTDPHAVILDRLVRGRAELEQPGMGAVGVGDAPVGDARRAARHRPLLRHQAELEAPDVEPDVIRLVEVGRHPGRFGVPRLRSVEVRHPVDRGPETEEMARGHGNGSGTGV